MKSTIINISACCLLAAALSACHSDDDNTFGITPDASIVSFTPTAGGAVMHYRLPASLDIQTIRVRYTDATGKENMIDGSYLADSLAIVGFNEARDNVPATISYVNRQGDESQAVATTFSTKDSGPYAFFNTADVKSAWNGVELTYDLPDKDMRGFAHVFYVGTNVVTNEPDTVLATTINLQTGQNSNFIRLEQAMDSYDIIIRTEDFRGYFVKSKEWNGVKAYQTQKFPTDQMKVTCQASYENENNKFGVEYLTDGDDRGYRAAQGRYSEYYTFAMGPYGLNNNIDIDLGSQQVLATVRIYAQCKVKESYSGIFSYDYPNLLPNEVTVYASNDANDWKQIGHYYQSPDADDDAWWTTNGLVMRRDELTYEDLSQIPSPVFMDVSFGISSDAYRYVRVVPNSVFNHNQWMPNRQQYVTMQELEVYTKK